MSRYKVHVTVIDGAQGFGTKTLHVVETSLPETYTDADHSLRLAESLVGKPYTFRPSKTTGHRFVGFVVSARVEKLEREDEGGPR